MKAVTIINDPITIGRTVRQLQDRGLSYISIHPVMARGQPRLYVEARTQEEYYLGCGSLIVNPLGTPKTGTDEGTSHSNRQ